MFSDVSNAGFWLADVMGDSVVAEKARLEPSFAKGTIQSSCYSYRFFGSMIAGPISTGLYKWMGPKSVIFLLAVLPFSILPLVYSLGDVRNGEVRSTKEQCQEIWRSVCSRSVWQPLGFVYIYVSLNSLFQVNMHIITNTQIFLLFLNTRLAKECVAGEQFSLESIPEDHSFLYEYPNQPYLHCIKCATLSWSHHIQVLYDAVVVEICLHSVHSLGWSL